MATGSAMTTTGTETGPPVSRARLWRRRIAPYALIAPALIYLCTLADSNQVGVSKPRSETPS